MENNIITDALHSILKRAVKETHTANGWSPMNKVGVFAHAMGYDSNNWGKLSRTIERFPDTFKVFEVSTTKKYVTLVDADYEVSKTPHTILTRTLGVFNNHRTSSLKIAEDVHGQLKPLIGDENDLAHNSEVCRSVISNGFCKLKAENKILISKQHTLWNTGLRLSTGNCIWGYGEIDLMGHVRNIKFCVENSMKAEKLVVQFGQAPLPPVYGELKGGDFRPDLEIKINEYHILVERYFRFPEEYKAMVGIACNKENWRIFKSNIEDCIDFTGTYLARAIQRSRHAIARDKDIAIKYWDFKRNSMNWLIPVNLGVKNTQYRALIVEYCSEEGKSYYKARTILNLDMAYKNARLIKPVVSDWLHFETVKH